MLGGLIGGSIRAELMTRRSKFYHRCLYPCVDFVLASLFACCSPYVTNAVAEGQGHTPQEFLNLLTASPFLAGAALVAVPVILRHVGFYHKRNLQRVGNALKQILSFAVYYLCGIGLYLALEETSAYYSLLLLVNLLGISLVVFLRYLLVRWYYLHSSRAEELRRQIILAGTAEAMEKGWASLPEYWTRNFNVVGRIEPGDGNEVLVQKLIEEHSVNGLYVFGGLAAHHVFENVIYQCEVQGIDVNMVLGNRMGTSLRADINEVGDARMLVLCSTPVCSWSRAIKALMDRIVALIILLCSSPLWVVAAVGIKLSDPKGPVFFRQRRSGVYGRVFHMWKFRSMYVDAEARLEEVKAKYGNEMNGPIFKLTNDPRIFKFGHFIRKTSIDELPQLLNILSGDMSIVGPRPLPVYETEAFPRIEHRRRLSVKPGLTCFWQIEDRSDNGDFDNMVNKDLRYIDEWSLWLDVKLFFRTIPAVLFRKGAK